MLLRKIQTSVSWASGRVVSDLEAAGRLPPPRTGKDDESDQPKRLSQQKYAAQPESHRMCPVTVTFAISWISQDGPGYLTSESGMNSGSLTR